MADQILTDVGAKVAINAFTEIFKTAAHGLSKFGEWAKAKNQENDYFGLAAKQYTTQLEKRYNLIRIIGMSEPIPLLSVYIRVNILKKITAAQRETIEDLQQYFDYDKRGFGSKIETKDGLEAVNTINKIIVLGKPGSGKTTFLKYITLQAIQGNLEKKPLPIFISLKDFSDSNTTLIEYITNQFDICHFPEAKPFIEKVLDKGNCLLLLDGLDEVNKEKEDKIIKQIKDFTEKYLETRYILSCRIAAYNYCFEKFTDIEIADFNDAQIENFVLSWFGSNTTKADACWNELKENKPIKELASTPLLLTLLCLAFDETLHFPPNRAELYKEALDALLKKWDTSRSIMRPETYKNLSLKRKETLCSRIAFYTFENDQYFIPQTTLERYIAEFIKNLPNATEDTLELDSEAVLKSIESQHGIFVERARKIYSFSHLTFQEYFTAKYIIDNAADGTLERIVEKHSTNDKWREVFLIVTGLLEQADKFLCLIENKINSLRTSKVEIFLKSIDNNQTLDDLVNTAFPNKLDKLPTKIVKILLTLNRALTLVRSLAAQNNNEPNEGVQLTITKDLDPRQTRKMANDLEKIIHLNSKPVSAPQHYETSIHEKYGLPKNALAIPHQNTHIINSNKTISYTINLATIKAVELWQTLETNLDLEPILTTSTEFQSFLPLELDLILNKTLAQTRAKSISDYLKACLLLITCINTDCYISKEVRIRIINNLLT